MTYQLNLLFSVDWDRTTAFDENKMITKRWSNLCIRYRRRWARLL